MIDIDVDIRNLPEFRAAVKALGKRVNDPKAIKKFVQPGVKPIRDSIRAATPKSKVEHHYYRNKKKVSTFKPGHLQKSTQDISQLKRRYKKIPAIYIGPVYTSKAGEGGVFGNTIKDVDAFYAHMVFGSAAAYEKRVIQASYRSAKKTAEGLILRKAEQVIKENGKKSGLTT